MNLRHETNKIFTSSNKHRLENKIWPGRIYTKYEYSKYSRFCCCLLVVIFTEIPHIILFCEAHNIYYSPFSFFFFKQKNLIQKFITQDPFPTEKATTQQKK